MKHKLIFFDLDDTLYPSNNGLWRALKQRMGDYMRERLHIPAEDIPRLREMYFRNYGTTLRGLQHFYDINTAEYLDYVHNVPLEQYIQPDPALRAMLKALPYRRWILTNADSAHARRVLKQLGVEDLFEGIVDTLAMHPFCKPQPEGFATALQTVHLPARACIMVDDLPATTRAARDLGFFSVLVNGRQAMTASDDADAVIAHILALPRILPD